MIRAKIGMVKLPKDMETKFASADWEVNYSDAMMAYYISKSFQSITREELEKEIRSIIPKGTECWWLSSFETVA